MNTIIKGEEFLNELSDCQRRKRDCLIIGIYGCFCTKCAHIRTVIDIAHKGGAEKCKQS